MNASLYALHAVIIRALRTIANAYERWLKDQRIDED